MPHGRILMISTHGYLATDPQLGKPDTGGQVVYVLELSKALANRGFEIDILTRQFDDQPPFETIAAGVRLVRIPYGGPSFLPKEVLFRHVPELMEALHESRTFEHEKYSLINSHYWDAGVAGLRISKVLGVPHVHTPHSMGLLKRQNRAWGPSGDTPADHLDERIHYERMIYHQSRFIVSTASEQTRCLKECDEYNVSEEKILQIPPGFDESTFRKPLPSVRAECRQSLGWTVPTVFSAGRLAVSKGYDLLIRAFPAVLRRVPDAQLVLAIGTPHASIEESQFLSDLKQLAQHLGISQRVCFTECVGQRKLSDYYRAADVFVLGSRNEPFGMTAIEAMASGTPTVVTTRGGLWEELIWGQECVYCDPMDSDALAQSICSTLIHERIRERISTHGAATALSRYTWTKIATRFIDECCTGTSILPLKPAMSPVTGKRHYA